MTGRLKPGLAFGEMMGSIAKDIIAKLCRDFVVDAHEDGPIPCVVTPMSYPNGDSINLYFQRSGRRMFASDEGTTIDNVFGGMAYLSVERKKIIDMICARTDVLFTGSKFSKALRAKNTGEDCLSLCQTIVTVSGLYYQQEQHERSLLKSD